MTSVNPKEVFEVLQKSILVDGFDVVYDVEKSKGARFYDSKNDRTMIDFFSFFASNPLGFNHPRMHDKAFEQKLLNFARTKVSNSDIYTTAYAEFVQSFHQNCAPTFDRLFFIEGGGLAVENAIKVAQDWKVQKNLKAGRGEKGTQVLHFKEAFHGRTGFTMSLTNTDPTKVKYFAKFDWPRVTNPKVTFPANAQNAAKVEDLEKQSIKEIEAAFQQRPHEICCIILESIQGEGGDNFFRPEFFKALRKIADHHEALLIYDEVQAGMGITGKMWAYENFDVEPDLIAFGKKTQVCGMAARTKRIDDVDNVFKVPSRINSTWGGNIVDMVRCTQFISVIKEESLLNNATKLGGAMLKEIENISKQDSRVTNCRGIGFWNAFDLPSKGVRDRFIEKAWELGLMILSSGPQSVRIRPILNLKQDEADEGLELIKKSLKAI